MLANICRPGYLHCLGMATVSVHELKDTLSAVLASVEAGESVEVTRYGKPIAVITAVASNGRPMNVDPGSVSYDDEAFSPTEINDMLNTPVFPG
jgi:prevent-host-death family protein